MKTHLCNNTSKKPKPINIFIENGKPISQNFKFLLFLFNFAFFYFIYCGRVVTKSYKLSPEKKPRTQSPIVIRRSLRTRGMPPAYSDFKALDDPVEATPMAAKTLTQSNPSARDLGPLSSRDAYRGTGSDKLLMERILSVSKKPSEDFGYENGGDSIKGVCDRLELGSLSLNPENIARVVPGKIMNVRFLPCSNSKMIVVGNKFGDVGFWDVDSSMDKEDGIYLYHPHPGPISGISIQQQCSSKVIWFEKIACIVLNVYNSV